jgi:hypothetical protein
MKRLITICAVVGMILAISGTAQATLFTFDTVPEALLENTDNQTTISNYMTGLYGSMVTVSDAGIRDNGDTSTDWIWPGRSNSDNFMRTDSSEDFEILFAITPVTSISGLGYVFEHTTGDDIVIKGYGSNYTASGGNVENPNPSALVGTWSANPGDNQQVSFSLSFSSDAYLLVISDSGEKDVAIDDLTVTPTPEPATIALLGLGALSLLRRKRSV